MRISKKRSIILKTILPVIGIALTAPSQALSAEFIPSGNLFPMVTAVAIIGSALFIFYRMKQQMEKKNAELRGELFERQCAEKELMASQNNLVKSLEEKEALIKEIHHRVKNNLQIISSLLYLQEADVKEQKTLEILKESQNRIKSMALIHEQLYGLSDFSRIDFGVYIHDLTSNLFNSYGIDPLCIGLKVKTDPINLDIDTAVPLGLIINELVSNSLKHAFPHGEKGILNIGFHAPSKEKRILTVSDNGIGLSTYQNEKKPASLGLRLVKTLVSQLDGILETESGNSGTCHVITMNAC